MKKIICMCLLFASSIHLQAQWSHVGPIKDNSSGNYFESGRLDCIVPDIGFNGTTNQTLYAGSMSGGLWVTTNFCTSWAPVVIPDYVQYHGITALAPSTAGYILAATMNTGAIVANNGNIYLFDPSTNSWTASNFNTVSGPTGAQVKHIRVCPTNSSLVMAASTTGIYQSTDGGNTWSLSQAGNYENVDFIPANYITGGYYVYACGDNTVDFSTDGGLTFSPKASVIALFPSGFYADMAITFDSSNPNTQYIYYDALVSGNTHYIGRLSIDKVTSGLEVATFYNTMSEPAGAADRMQVGADDKVVYFGHGGLGKYNTITNQGYQVSGGDSPSSGIGYNSPGHSDSHDILMLPSLNKIIWVNDGGCFVDSYTPGVNQVYTNSWAAMNNNLNISQIWGLSCAEEDENEYFTGEQDTKAFRTNAATTTFYSGGTEPSLVLIDKFDKNNYFQSNYVTTDYIYGEYNGSSFGDENYEPNSVGGDICNSSLAWCSTFDCFPGPEFGSNTLFQDPNRPDKIFFGTKSDGLMEFCPTNKVFTRKKGFTTPGTWQQYINGMAFSRADKNIVYASMSSRNYPGDQEQPEVMKFNSPDFDDSWAGHNDNWIAITPNFALSPFTVPVNYPQTAQIEIVGIAASDWNPNRIWTAMRYVPGNPGIKVIKYEAGTWTDYSTGIPSDEIPISLVYEQGTNDQMYLGTNVNVYYRNNFMSSWAIYSTSLPNIAINQLRINYKENSVRAGTYGQGMWKSSLSCPSNNTLSVTGTISTDNFYEAHNAVTVQNHTVTGGDIKYRSGTVIDFLPDVLITASSSCTAFAFIHGCDAPGNTFRRPESTDNDEVSVDPKKEDDLNSLNVYPNPSSDVFTISMDHSEKGVIEVYDVLGNKVQTLELKNNTTEYKLDMSNYPKGIYMLNVTSNDKRYSKKILLE